MRFPEGLQDFEAVPARQHQVENDEIEDLGVGAEESIFTRRRHDDVVVFPLQGQGGDVCQFALVFDDEHPHYLEMLSTCGASDPDFCVRKRCPSKHGQERSQRADACRIDVLEAADHG